MYQSDQYTNRYRRWWEHPKEAHHGIRDKVSAIDDSQTNQRELNLHHLRLYSNFAASSLAGSDYTISYSDGRLKMNVVKAVIDTVCAHISTIRTKPQYTTSGGSYSQKRKARNLSKFVLGQFLYLKQYKLGLKVFRDAAIFGTGIEHVYREDGDIKAERVFPNEIIVDQRGAKFSAPREIFRHKEVDRDTAISLYPKHRKILEDASSMRDQGSGSDTVADPVSLIEVHRPPCGRQKGHHAIICSEGVLVFEEWARRFPYSVFYWCDPVLGFYGTGLGKELTEIQLEINFTLQKIQKSMTLAATQIWTREGSINRNALNNEDLAVHEYKIDPPHVLNIEPIAKQYFEHCYTLWDKAFELAGVSQISATGNKPSGLDSGVALRTQQDIESKRFQNVQQNWEDHTLDTGDCIVETSRQIDEETPGGYKSIAVSDDRSLEDMSFRDVDLKGSRFIVRVWPTSLLPATPAGKLQTLKELGEINPELQKLMMMRVDVPDLEAATQLMAAPYDIIDLLLERMLEHGEYRAPEPYYDLELALRLCQRAAIRAEIDGVSEERVQLVRNFMSQCSELLAPPPPSPEEVPPPSMAPGLPPDAVPGVGGPLDMSPPGPPPPVPMAA